MPEINNADKKFILIRAGILFAIAVILSLIAVLGMKCMNKGIGGNPDEDTSSDSLDIVPDSSSETILQSASVSFIPEEYVPDLREDFWEVSEVSIYVDSDAVPLLDSLPMAPSPDDVPFEVLLLVRLWAEYSGLTEAEIDKVYVFNNQDTLYVDLPKHGMNYGALCQTVMSRFSFFTRLYPIVSGNIVSGYEDGMHIGDGLSD